ncbi:HAMP domain-containing sensor histidine kinase [Clostridiaceae bacterium M8S5]|nr:HAMP domain-containing sensor histidine kinase [Clostridiaceae bacterium M8S5]
MKISIKKRLTIFILLLLLSNLLIISFFVLKGIERNQVKNYEQLLKDDSKTVNLFIREKYALSNVDSFEKFYISNSRVLCVELSRLLNLYTALYDNKGNRISIAANYLDKEETQLPELVKTALDNQIAYQQVGYLIYYVAPVYDFDKQIGVVMIEYDIKKDRIFFEEIRKLLITVGLASIIITFFLSTFYLLHHVKKILRLRKSVKAIEKGDYTSLFKVTSKDELGELSQGIEVMANKIKRNIRDIESEKNKLEDTLGKLQRLEMKQKEFIGNITHEFKTPITIIKAQLDLMTLYDDDQNMVKNSKEIALKELNRLNSMVENILYLSSVEQYDYKLKDEAFRIDIAINEVLDKMKGKASKFGITIESFVEEAIVWMDRDSVIQILINLIDNGIKYNVINGKIIVSGYADKSNYVIDIEDTGIGVPDEHKNSIFEPFYTIDKNRSKAFSGTGLGLALVKKLLEKQNGFISLVGSDKSTIFKVQIPIYQEDTNL